MNIMDIITKKKNKESLLYDEIKYAVDNFISGEVKDYQMSSLLMAIVLNGMDEDETFNLTKIMLDSGDKIDLSKINGIKVDKHSTGGVGDKTTLVVAPIVAACGVPVAKMSGKGLGFTGGTIDKLESIYGFNTNISNDDFIKQVNDMGIALVSQSGNLVPADKKIYALRDVTGTTESIPLIASSIMSKKLASGADKIVLDVKVGKGAFMKSIDDARLLAKTMINIGKKFDKEVVAVLTNMDCPLGKSIGNHLEVDEAIETLSGKGNKEFTELCLVLATYMVSMGKKISLKEASILSLEKLNNKEALNKFFELIKRQGGDITKNTKTKFVYELKSKEDGFVYNIDSLELAKFANSLGAGRENKEDRIDYSVGIVINKTVNSEVKKGDILLYIYSNSEVNISGLYNAIDIKNIKNHSKLILDIIK